MNDDEGLHYHVRAGTVGCLPEMNEVFLDLDGALAYFRQECSDYRDANVQVDEVRVLAGPVRRDCEECWAYAAIQPINYLQVVRCNEWLDCQLYRESVEALFDEEPV